MAADGFVAPSAYLQQLELTSEQLQRHAPFVAGAPAPQILDLLDVASYSAHKDTGASLDRPLFEPHVGEIRFQNFEPLRTYELSLVLRNVDRVARKVTVMQSTSPHFKVIPPKDQSSKVAAGMQVQYTVRFTPDAAQDYTGSCLAIKKKEKKKKKERRRKRRRGRGEGKKRGKRRIRRRRR